MFSVTLVAPRLWWHDIYIYIYLYQNISIAINGMLIIILYIYLNLNLYCTSNAFVMYHTHSSARNVDTSYVIFKVFIKCFMYIRVIYLPLLKAR